MYVQRIDIFVSSPSDVTAEREAIRRVIERLNRLEFIRQRYLLVALLYEDEVPPEVGESAQVIVNRYMTTQNSYITICVFWARMGTPFKITETGKEYLSGTHYEFLCAY